MISQKAHGRPHAQLALYSLVCKHGVSNSSRHLKCRRVSLRSACFCMHCSDLASVASSRPESCAMTACSLAISSRFSRVSSTSVSCLSSSFLHCAATWHASTCPGTHGVSSSLGGSRQTSRSVNILKSRPSAPRRPQPPRAARLCAAGGGGPARSPSPGRFARTRQQVPRSAKASPMSSGSWQSGHRPRGQSRASAGTSTAWPWCLLPTLRSRTRRASCKESSVGVTQDSSGRSRAPVSQRQLHASASCLP
mmetsp:Transcript_80761/g.237339  ORF Transcript_80761/g.237339 Transcript_80761/m.237339 type:complete len:251 (-) Transcript_80761:632-1384(-)